MDTFTSKIGTSRQIPASRVWIEGKRLVGAGFVVAARYTLTEVGSTLVLTLAVDGKRKVSGKGETPIIDVTGDTIRRMFAGRETVTVDYTNGKIVIR
jgi:hypothetical protein